MLQLPRSLHRTRKTEPVWFVVRGVDRDAIVTAHRRPSEVASQTRCSDANSRGAGDRERDESAKSVPGDHVVRPEECKRDRQHDRRRTDPDSSRLTSSAYERASCAYPTSRGLTAATAAAASPTWRETSSAPAAYTTGFVAVPMGADNDGAPPSPLPKASVHNDAMT